jgi:hypothetical protein
MRIYFISIILINNLYPISGSELFHEPPLYSEVGKDLILEVVSLSDQTVIEAKGYYRVHGSMSYHEKRLSFTGTSWQMKISGSSLPESALEYCFTFNMSNGSMVAAPEFKPFEQPFLIHINPSVGKDKIIEIKTPVFNKLIDADILILSPEPGSYTNDDETFIAVSLFNVFNVDSTSIKLLIDGKDVTYDAEISDGIIAYTPSKIEKGKHKVEIKMSTFDGVIIKPVSWNFNVKQKTIIPSQFKYDASVITKVSSEFVGQDFLNYADLNAKARFEVEYADLKVHIRKTSRENPYMQPLDRTSLNINFMKYLDLKVGDFYESITPYTLDGRRVRGLSVDLNMRFFRAQVIQGQLIRAVQHLNKVDAGYYLQGRETIIDTLGHPVFTLDRKGYSFDRDFFLTRLSFEIFSYKFGVHFMKATDDINSVYQFISDGEFYVDSSDVLYNDSLFNIPLGIYSYNKFATAVENVNGTINFPEKNWGSNKPQDNLVVGFDFGKVIDKDRIKFEFSWNMSLYNRDIWDGVMTRTQLDTALDDTLDGKIGTIYDEDGNITEGSLNIDTLDVFDPLQLEDLFIININMLPLLPVDPTTFETNPISSIVNMPSSAFHLRLLGNYRFSKFTIHYRQIGPEYVSLANPYLTDNMREFTISDRISLVDNKLLLNLMYRYKDDKILSSVVEPLKTTNLSVGITFMPGANSPSYVVNFQSIGKNNSKDQLDRVGSELMDFREDSKTNNTFFSVTYPFSIGNLKHNVNLNMNSIANEDQLAQKRGKDYFYQRSNSKSISMALSSKFVIPLRTVINYSRTSIQVPVQDIDGNISANELVWTSVSGNGHYSFLNNKLKINAGLTYLTNKGTTPLSLYGLKSGVDYSILKGMSATLSGHIQMRNDNSGFSLNTSGFLFSFRYNF